MNSSKNKPFYITVFAALFAYITYFSTMTQFDSMSDYAGHTYTYIPRILGRSGPNGWMAAPYCMWHLITIFFYKVIHLPIEASATCSSVIFALLSFYILYWMFTKILDYKGIFVSPALTATFTFLLGIIQPLSAYWFDTTSQYLGQFSINPIHNPTQMCVKPFSILCLCFAFDLLTYFDNKEHKGVFIDLSSGPKKGFIALAVSLFLSCFAKPTFAEMFIPAAGVLMLTEWIIHLIKKDKMAKEYFIKCLQMLLVSLPALLFILFQFVCYFLLGGSYGNDESHVIITKWMEVWKFYTDNVGLSVLLGMGFPIYMVIINGNYFVKSWLGRLSIAGYGIGLLECALLSEDTKMGDGDFLWPMMSGMTLLWIVSVLRLLVLSKNNSEEKSKNTALHIGWLLFTLYVLAGVYYLYGLTKGAI